MNRSEAIETLRSPAVAFPLAAVVAVATWLTVPSAVGTMLSITLFCIVLWVLTPVAPSYTGLIGLGLIAVTFSTDLALVGFQKPATWLIGFGLLMGEATRQSGLANAAGRVIATRSIGDPIEADSRRTYRRLLLALAIGAHVLAFLVPSALVRILALAPILRELGSLFDSREARVGLYLGPLFATFYGSSGILTADLPNIIISGFGQSIAGHTISWSEWWLHMYPVMGLVRVVLVVGIVYLLFRPPVDSAFEVPDTDGGRTDGTDAGTDTGTGAGIDTGAAERRMLAFLLVGAAIWATDFVHGFHPVIGAVVVVVLAFLPEVGVVDFETVGGEVDFSILFFIAAVFAIGDGLTETGFTDTAATYLLELIPTGAPLAVILASVFFITFALTFLMEGLAVASVLTPVLIPYIDAAGLPFTPVLLAETMALSSYFFPYQSAVLIVILNEGDIETRELILTTVACSAATILLLLPIQFGLFSVFY
ncbi:SLC13 family permease [Natrinema salifodinae]|uniref:Anion transporter n=1 Tax=Natrinema salifodinae TaxID=1202768 RepID=A0A1I0LYA2_9EURY|nr:SLC13 family permease [Natrinema salifodinae]SEV80078.1 anion transporter [Natrinema salifodinae]